jgi:uncharacterized protein YdaU (DUF1376 family)
MSDSKIFRIPWFPNQAYLDFSRLDPHEIGVLMQIINLIYMNQGPIENDPKWISRSFINFGTAKTRNCIEKLIDIGALFINYEGKISQKMSEKQLKNVQNSREFYSEMGSKGAESRKRNQQNQEFNFSPPKAPVEASNSISNSIRDIPPNPQGGMGGGSHQNNQPKNKRKKRNGKSNLAEQANKLLDKYADPEPGQDDDCLL